MDADSAKGDPAKFMCISSDLGALKSKLIFPQTRRNVRMGLGVDVWIKPKRDRRPPIHRARDLVDRFQFSLGSH